VTTLDGNAFLRLCAARDRLRAAEDPAPSVREIAKTAAMSPYHFIRVFTALFGETPHRLRTRARVERAKVLLALSRRDVTNVCLEVGLSSLGSFSELFARRVGASPSSFRRKIQAAMTTPGEWPAELIPGCLTLMGGQGADSQFSRSAKHEHAVRLRLPGRKSRNSRGKA
jgi:AraC-like DNA-binding protein